MTASQEVLRSLTIETINNYRKAANCSVNAIRFGSSRSLRKVDAGIDSLLSGYQGKLGKTFKNNLKVAQKQVDSAIKFVDTTVETVGTSVKSALVATQERIELASNAAENNVNKLADTAAKRLTKFPAKGGRLATLLQNDAVKTIDQFGFGIPTANVMRFVSEAVADGAEQIAAKIAVAPKKAAARKVVRKVIAKTRARRKVAA